jgi:hypothetical protein
VQTTWLFVGWENKKLEKTEIRKTEKKIFINKFLKNVTKIQILLQLRSIKNNYLKIARNTN